MGHGWVHSMGPFVTSHRGWRRSRCKTCRDIFEDGHDNANWDILGRQKLWLTWTDRNNSRNIEGPVTETDLSSVPSVETWPNTKFCGVNPQFLFSRIVCEGYKWQEPRFLKMTGKWVYRYNLLVPHLSCNGTWIGCVWRTLSGLILKFCVNDVISNLRVPCERFWTF